MSERLKRFFSHGGTIAFITGFFLYIAVVLPILINDKGIFTIVGDYSSQSIPFAYHIRDCLLSGNVCWDWSSGLGSQFLGDYAYYNLFSPFSLIYLIVPRDAIIYAMPFVTAVKYGTGSCLAYFYASRFLKNKHYAVIAGVIYMFSSFSGYNVIFHFSDVIALFPLLLIAVEELCVNKRRCVFALTVCFMALLNYYFFAGQAVFCVIYFFVRFFDRRFVNTLKKLLSVAFEAVTGFAMSAVFMLPVLFYLSASSKATGMISLSATNANLIWGADSPSHLNSLHDEGFTQFLDDSSLGFESGVYERITFDYKEICDLISVKYFAGLGETGDKYDGFRKVGTMGEYAIYENPDYIPMGFVYDSMISRDAFLNIEDKKLKHLTYLKALIVSDTAGFSDILTDISNTAGEEITDDEYKRLIEDRRRSAASSCEKTSNGLTAQIELEKENVVFFSVSYNEGWSAYVDGEKTDVYNVNNGCVGVRVHEGRHEIRLCYTVKGFNEGIAITAVSSGILILYAAVCGIRRKNGKAEV